MAFEPVQKHPRYRVSAQVAVITQAGDVEELALEDISLGGVFIRTPTPRQPGSFVRLRLPLVDGPLSLMGRVVHVIDAATGERTSREPGMGVQFDGVPPDTERALRRFVDGLVDAERASRAARRAARFVDATRVVVTTERAALARLWTDGLDRGALRAHGVLRGATRAGVRVVVFIGPLRLAADVVRVEGESAELRLVDLEAPRREAVRRFVAGEAAAIAIVDAAAPDRALTGALAAARRLLEGARGDDAHGALGLTATAVAAEITARAQELTGLFAVARAGATPPQRARLDEATQAAAALERALLGRLTEQRRATEPGDDVHEQVVELVAEAEFLTTASQRDEATTVLHEALVLAGEGAPNDVKAIAERLLDVDPRDERALLALLHQHERTESWRAAAHVGETLLRLRPTDAALRARVQRVLETARRRR